MNIFISNRIFDLPDPDVEVCPPLSIDVSWPGGVGTGKARITIIKEDEAPHVVALTPHQLETIELIMREMDKLNEAQYE